MPLVAFVLFFAGIFVLVWATTWIMVNRDFWLDLATEVPRRLSGHLAGGLVRLSRWIFRLVMLVVMIVVALKKQLV